MNLLAIETASTVCGTALFINDRLEDIAEVDQPRIHAERLPVFVDELLKKNRIDLGAMTGIAISSGPGSYTGLRIGMSLAKGLSFSHQLPLVPVPTLLSLETRVKLEEEHFICLHSHKEIVYAQKFAGGAPAGEAVCVPYSSLEKIPIFGHGIQAFEERNNPITVVTPSARHVGELALENFYDWQCSDLNRVQPYYLTEFNIRIQGK